MKIVVFEDDEMTLNTLRMCLVSRGYDVVAYSEPLMCPIYTDPSTLCDHDHACGDILITDNYMPRMTGLEFIEQQHLRGCTGILKHKAVLSGNLTHTDLEKALEMGCKVFAKPIVLKELFDWLQECKKNL